jgi:hypothetical protein
MVPHLAGGRRTLDGKGSDSLSWLCGLSVEINPLGGILAPWWAPLLADARVHSKASAASAAVTEPEAQAAVDAAVATQCADRVSAIVALTGDLP